MLGDESLARVSRDRRGLVCHGVVAGLAEPAGGTSLVSLARQISKSLFKRSEHVGWQNGGGAGWRAACGSGCTRGPETTTGDGGGSGRSHEQAARVGSSSSTSARTRGKTFGFIEGLSLFCSLALLELALLGLSLQRDIGAAPLGRIPARLHLRPAGGAALGVVHDARDDRARAGDHQADADRAEGADAGDRDHG